MKTWVHGQTRQAGFSTVSEYIRDVLRREQQRLTRSEIDEKLLDAIESGKTTPFTKSDWQKLREAGRQRLTNIKNSKKSPHAK
jgi:antitoxin ParD1/3/4